MIELKEYKTVNGELLLYTGNPELKMLEDLAQGPGDIWHSSLDQGYKNAFSELVYQTAVFFWYLNDFEDLDQCMSWRINPKAFVVRKSAWELSGGFDVDFENLQMQALDFGFRCIRFLGVAPLYVKDLFLDKTQHNVTISTFDRHLFFRKNYKISHALFMIYRLGFWKTLEWKTFFKIKKKYKKRTDFSIHPPRELNQIEEKPTISYIIPTMFRQEYSLQLLDDLSNQSYIPTQVIVVDATPKDVRDESCYFERQYPFDLQVIWQQSKGSCRARNEAIAKCDGEFIVFGDDDIRVPENFIENHIRFLQTYNAGACNGLDIRADHHEQDLNDLQNKLKKLNPKRFIAGEFVEKVKGNDVNFDGGYGEDSDFGMMLTKKGVAVLSNPFSAILHLKPPSGGYRFWGIQAKITGKNRKIQPWELDIPVKLIRPVPSPTVMYGIIKHYTPQQLIEYKHKHFSYYIFKGSKYGLIYRLLRLPYKSLQFKKSVFYAKRLINLGIRYQ